MPERTIASDRQPISRDSGATITGNGRSIPISTGIATRDVTGRRIATEEEMRAYANMRAPTEDEIRAINARILANSGKYLAVPWNPYYSNQPNTVAPSQPTGTFYGNADPFAVLSDVFRNVFGSGGDAGQQQQTGQALVPVTSTTGGSNWILIVVVIAIAGFAYYYYKKRQNA